MKIVVIGLGSMGKRRIRLIKQNFEEMELVGVDSRIDRRNEVNDSYGMNTYDTIESAVENEKPSIAFICVSPEGHAEVLANCLNYRLHVFSEINLINENHNKLITEAKEKGLKLFLSSTPIYRKEIQFITEKIRQTCKIVNYRYHVGQYLQDWHPWENYMDFFVRNKKTNGCRELFAIELPWIINAFGRIKHVTAVKGKISDLKIDYPDAYIVIVEHDSGNFGVINLDIVSRKAVRTLEIYSENLHLFWDGTPESLQVFDINSKQMQNIFLYDKIEKNSNYAENIIENMYIEEISSFFKFLEEQYVPCHDFEKDIEMLEIIDRIEGVI